MSSGTSAVTLANNHSDLHRLWAQEETKRADGGWWSLSGFSIQAMIGFERFVRRLLIDREPGHVAFETISDLMEVDGKVRLTQVKRTLTKESLASAILEACKILALCTQEFAKTIEFQIICERDSVGLKPKDIPPGSIFKGERHDVSNLRCVIDQFNKAEPIKVMGSPGLSLRRTLLIAGVSNPDQVARIAVGTLFSAFDGKNREGIETALYRAIDQIKTQAKPDGASPGRLLTSEMFVRQPTGQASLFTSSRPRLADLVGDRFLERPTLLGTVIGAAEAWLASLEDSYRADDLRLPVLWLEGRSGDGKSVLTLQLLEALVARRARLPSVLELDDLEELSSWLKSATHWEQGGESQAEIAFIDDLASRAERADIDTLIERAFYRGSSYAGLITCGTVGGRKTFAKGRHVSVTRIAIPAPTAADYETLRGWAQQRLGRALSQSDPAGSSISHFMTRLSLDGQAKRRPEYRTPEELRGALAVNALGLPAPQLLLPDELVSEFGEAWSDLDLSPIKGEDGVRIAHAEAAWQLYIEAVKDMDLLEAWGSDLARVLVAHLTSRDTTAARKLLGSLMHSQAYSKRLIDAGFAGKISEVMDKIYVSVAETCSEELRACLFRIWLPACTRGMLTAVDTTALREEGRSLLANRDIDSETKSEIATTLLLVARSSDQAHGAAAAYLKHTPPGYAVEKFTITVLKAGPKKYGTELTNVAISWLASNQNAVEIGPVLAQVIGAAPPKRLQAISLNYIKEHVADAASGPVLCALSNLKVSKEFVVAQNAWLKNCADPRSAIVIYRKLFQARPPNWRRRYIPRALKFIRDHPNEPAQQDVLSILVRWNRLNPSVLGAARKWVDSRVNEPNTVPVLIELLNTPNPKTEDIERALRFIETSAPGKRTMLDTLSVILNNLSKNEQINLRSQLPNRFAKIFEQTIMRKPKKTKMLSDLDKRLRTKKARLWTH